MDSADRENCTPSFARNYGESWVRGSADPGVSAEAEVAARYAGRAPDPNGEEKSKDEVG